MLAHMKERIAGKIGNANDNAFKLRKLFKMYDATGSGSVSTPPIMLSSSQAFAKAPPLTSLQWVLSDLQGTCEL